MQPLINSEEKNLISQQNNVQHHSLQDKYDQLANLSVTNPRQHDIPDLTEEMEKNDVLGLTYTKQIHEWLRTLMWESEYGDAHPDISYLELYVNFK